MVATEQLAFGALARTSDPDTSHAAAQAVTPAVPAIEEAILTVSNQWGEGCTAHKIAERVEKLWPNRWTEGGIRTRVSNMGKRGLLVKSGKGLSPRGQKADLWLKP